MKSCESCGATDVPLGERYCQHCGAEVVVTQADVAVARSEALGAVGGALQSLGCLIMATLLFIVFAVMLWAVAC